MPDNPQFLFTTCQIGAEGALKRELAREWPDFRFAYSRPGFLTFKLPAEHGLADDFNLRSVFARSYGFSLGKVSGDNYDEAARATWELYAERPAGRLHVWARDSSGSEAGGVGPALTEKVIEAEAAIRRNCSQPELLEPNDVTTPEPARRSELVLDCVLVEPNEWWVGYHRVRSVASRWPGGILPLELPDDAVSRAWLKMEEALRWSELPISEGAKCAEIGSAPGGASQALLSHGFYVTGIDPAEMHPDVLGHPRFTHIRRRVIQVRRREFRKIRWLTADMNVSPKYTLDAVEEIVTHREIRIRGMLLTLKPLEWARTDEIPDFLRRIRGWGFEMVSARQLQHNRQEICVAALRKAPRPASSRRHRRRRPHTGSHSGRT